MATLGGNLCQRPRCWYYRQNFPCYKHGGTTCFAYEGENQYHAILGGGPCYIVHPSDGAVALMALGATLHVAGAGGERTIAIDDFFVLPAARLDAEHVLRDGEVIVAVELPAYSSGGAQFFDKVMQRSAWDFALVSLAAVRRTNGDVRLVLGGVAPIPWRVTSSVEEDVASGNLSQDDIDTLADRALYDARPLGKNGYKVDLAGALLRRGMASVQAGGSASRT
jgi:xanthine dehydrogenase YagS FAD-binding subunit